MNKRLLYSLFKQYLFWLLFFAFERLVFIIYAVSISKTEHSSLWELLQTFYYALYLDNAMAAYLIPIPFFMQWTATMFKLEKLWNFHKYYFLIIIIICSFVIIGQLELYKEWSSKINYKAIFHLQNPKEVLTVISLPKLILFLSTVSFIAIGFYYIYLRFFFVIFEKKFRHILVSIIILILTPPILLIMARGGLQQIPIVQSDVFFSNKYFLNLAATNSHWNLINSLHNNRDHQNNNPYQFYNFEEAKLIRDKAYETETDTTIKVIQHTQPNIVFIILESWTADVVKTFGGFDSIAPNINQLSDEGIAFINTYCSAELSDQGISSILSGFPSVTTTAAIRQPEKMVKLDCFVKDFQDLGYYTSFIYGGQLTYGNIKGYLMQNKFDKLIEEKDFDRSIPRGRLNIHDQYVFDRFLNELDKQSQPFFSCIFNGSSHSPFDHKHPEKFNWGGNLNKYINAVYFADSCIGDFFEKAKTKPWYNNTLFILVSDHSHDSPRSYKYRTPPRKKIVFTLYGNVIHEKFKGTKIERFATQEDIPATLLAQFDLNYSRFNWSRNLFNPYEHNFSFYTYDDGCALINPDGFMYYDHKAKQVQDTTFPTNKEHYTKKALSILQTLFEEFRNM
jgi:phosphoglycerol transferase MdoB-like AlkP superfamily enzyme